MDILGFKDRIAIDDLKEIELKEDTLNFFNEKYKDAEIQGAFRVNADYNVVYFKQKLWFKLAYFSAGSWIMTRVASLKNKLPEATMKALEKKLKKKIHIIRMESVISSNADFYYYIIAKVSSQKKVLHVSKDGEVILNTKFQNYKVTVDVGEEGDNEDEEIIAEGDEPTEIKES